MAAVGVKDIHLFIILLLYLMHFLVLLIWSLVSFSVYFQKFALGFVCDSDDASTGIKVKTPNLALYVCGVTI